jgi:hypothetical protein
MPRPFHSKARLLAWTLLACLKGAQGALLADDSGLAPVIQNLPATVDLDADSATPVGPSGIQGSPPLSLRWERILRSPVTPNAAVVRVPDSEGPELVRSRWQDRDTGVYELVASNAWGVSTGRVQVVVRRPALPVILAQPLQLNVLAGAPVETPLILDGRPPLRAAWWLDGVRLANQDLAAPVLPNRAGFTGGTLVAVVTNRFGGVTSAPIQVTVVGTNLYRQDFNGRTAPGWVPAFSQSLTNENRWGRSGFTTRPGSFRLTNAVPMGQVVFGFDVWAQDSWDGDDALFGPDRWTASADGVPLVSAAFSNNDDRIGPSYFLQRLPVAPGVPQIAPRLGSLGLNPSDSDWSTSPENIGRLRVDSPYRMRYAVTNRTDVFSADFVGEGIGDESWALDNVYLSRLPAELSWIRFATPAVAANEDHLEATLVVERSGNTELPLEIRVATQDASAVAGIDYVPLGGKLGLLPGETRKNLVVTLIGNARRDPARSFGIWLLDAGTNGVFLGQPFAAVAIRDDESSVRLVSATNRIPSGTTTRIGHVERTGDLTEQVSFEVRLEPGTAQLGQDFRPYGATTNVGWMYFEIGATRAIPRYHYTTRPEDPLVVAAAADAAWDGPVGFSVGLDLGDVAPVSGDAALQVLIYPAVARLQIEPMPEAAGGFVRLRIETPPGTTGRLEQSPDLRVWTPLETVGGTVVRELAPGAGGYFRVVAP